MQADDKRANKVYQIEEITNGLKRTTNTLGVPILLLAQLSRALENRDNKRPQLSDLRDSGAIEQDADVVMFLHREEYYLAQQKGNVSSNFCTKKRAEKEAATLADLEAIKGKAEIIIAKNRQGRTGIIDLGVSTGEQAGIP